MDTADDCKSNAKEHHNNHRNKRYFKKPKKAIDTRHIPRRAVIFKNPLLLVFFGFVKEL